MHGIDLIHYRPCVRQPCLLVLLLLLLPTLSQAAEVRIEKASTRLQNSVYILNADIDYELSDEVLEAINNGISVTMLVTVRIERPRRYLWDYLIAETSHRYELQYHALSGQYLIKSRMGGQRSYLSLSNALRALGQIRGLAILEQKQLQDPQDAVVRIKTELDTNALPAPLRPVAWLSAQWKLSSEWFTCPLRF